MTFTCARAPQSEIIVFNLWNADPGCRNHWRRHAHFADHAVFIVERVFLRAGIGETPSVADDTPNPEPSDHRLAEARGNPQKGENMGVCCYYYQRRLSSGDS